MSSTRVNMSCGIIRGRRGAGRDASRVASDHTQYAVLQPSVWLMVWVV